MCIEPRCSVVCCRAFKRGCVRQSILKSQFGREIRWGWDAPDVHAAEALLGGGLVNQAVCMALHAQRQARRAGHPYDSPRQPSCVARQQVGHIEPPFCLLFCWNADRFGHVRQKQRISVLGTQLFRLQTNCCAAAAETPWSGAMAAGCCASSRRGRALTEATGGDCASDSQSWQTV